jgi:DNA-binding CsgD family transcriptional regulator
MRSDLSPRELEVLSLAAQGHTDEMIAQKLGIESGTVNSYWVRIRGKMGHLSRTELVARHVQKAADERHAMELAQAQMTSDGKFEGLVDEQARALRAANDEIERLKKLLARRKNLK